MPRINITGQEKPYGPKHDWKTIQNMIYENLFCSIPEEVEHIREEVDKFLKEEKNVCETDRRNND